MYVAAALSWGSIQDYAGPLENTVQLPLKFLDFADTVDLRSPQSAGWGPDQWNYVYAHGADVCTLHPSVQFLYAIAGNIKMC